MAELDADLVEPGRAVRRTAGCIRREDATGELVDAALLCRRRERLEQVPSEPATASAAADVHRVLADALVDAAIGVAGQTGPAHDGPLSVGIDGDEERQLVLEPREHLGGGAKSRLEGGLTALDALVVDRADRVRVGALGGADHRCSLHVVRQSAFGWSAVPVASAPESSAIAAGTSR